MSRSVPGQAGALLSALAPSAAALYGARIVAAMGAGLFTPVAASVALASGGADEQGKLLSRVFFGLTLAQVVGVPAGSWLGYTFGWQAAFLVVLLLTVAVSVGVWRLVPRHIDFEVNDLTTLTGALRDWASLVTVLFTTSFLGAIYVLFTYLQPLLEMMMGFGRDGVTGVLVMFGLGAVLGNLLGGQLNDRLGPGRTLVGLCVAQAVLMPLFSWLPLPPAALFLLVLVWSICGRSFLVPQQTAYRASDSRPPERGTGIQCRCHLQWCGRGITGRCSCDRPRRAAGAGYCRGRRGRSGTGAPGLERYPRCTSASGLMGPQVMMRQHDRDAMSAVGR